MVNKVCDENCNECVLLGEGNTKMLTAIFNRLNDEFGDGVYNIVQELCPNLTVCHECGLDDFCHIEGCSLAGGI